MLCRFITFIPIIRCPVSMLLVVRPVVLVCGCSGRAAAGARAALAARAELLADAARCNTPYRSHATPSAPGTHPYNCFLDHNSNNFTITKTNYLEYLSIFYKYTTRNL